MAATVKQRHNVKQLVVIGCFKGIMDKKNHLGFSCVFTVSLSKCSMSIHNPNRASCREMTMFIPYYLNCKAYSLQSIIIHFNAKLSFFQGLLKVSRRVHGLVNHSMR